MSNLRGALLMVIAMALFAGEDGIIKTLSGAVPVGQILIVLGGGGGFLFWLLLRAKGGRLLTRDILAAVFLLRNAGELFGTLGYVLAVALTPLSSASAIIQAIPLVVVFGAAVFFREQVGWRRWSAVLVGCVGVLLVLQPGVDGFQMESLFAVQGVIGLAIRDLATRKMPAHLDSYQISSLGFYVAALAGIIITLVDPAPFVALSAGQWAIAGASICFGMLGYAAIVAATRSADISAIAPFRYSRLVFGMIIGITVFGETPNGLTYLGSFIIVTAGIYALWRETRAKAA